MLRRHQPPKSSARSVDVFGERQRFLSFLMLLFRVKERLDKYF
jgi:hypothetical protein